MLQRSFCSLLYAFGLVKHQLDPFVVILEGIDAHGQREQFLIFAPEIVLKNFDLVPPVVLPHCMSLGLDRCRFAGELR